MNTPQATTGPEPLVEVDDINEILHESSAPNCATLIAQLVQRRYLERLLDDERDRLDEHRAQRELTEATVQAVTHLTRTLESLAIDIRRLSNRM